MSRIRSIHPGLFTDEAYVSVSMAARVLLPGLWTECDDGGVFEWKPLTLKMKLFPADNVDMEALLAELLGADSIRKFSIEGKEYGAARNFCKWQRPKAPVYRHQLPHELRTYVALKGASGEVVPNSFPTEGEISPQREEGGGRKEERKKVVIRAVGKPTRPVPEEFEEFKKAYPKRKGANPWKPAFEKWKRAIAAGADPGKIIDAVKSGVGFDRDKIGTEYIPQAVKWLNDQRWEDYAPPTTENQTTIFVAADSPHWEGVARRWRHEQKREIGPPKRDYQGVTGWHFPVEWVPQAAQGP